MLAKVLNTTVLATVLSASVAGAQGLAQLGGPSNLPPAGFAGQQFVDNRGCLFLRAGFGTTVNWVPRVDRRHKPLCGYPPTFGAPVVAAVEEDLAPDPHVVVAAPMVVAPVVAARPVVVAAAQPQPLVGEPVAALPRRQGSLQEMLFGSPRQVQAASPAPVVAASNAVPPPPRGYKLAWKDDRLNPRRGLGTAEGQARQDQVWTRDVPAVLVAAQPQATAAARPRVTVSTMSAPEAPVVQQAQPMAQAAASYVQVGTFGQPENADGVKARLAALGLPVSAATITRKGKVLQIVYAGPFGSAAAARAALNTARGAGFGDAILR